MIVGVHGIAQQQTGRAQLLRSWGPALRDGVELAANRPVADIPFDLAFYGNLFLGSVPTGTKSGVTDTEVPAGEDADQELVEAAMEALTPGELAAAEQRTSKANTRSPRPVQVVLRALDAKFGASAGVLYLGTLRQVRRYLVDPALKAEVDTIVDGAVRAGCRTLVGHSLGSVVALEYVRRHPDRRLDLLVTLGSPLGLRMVSTRAPSPFLGADSATGIPDNVARWVNVRDPRDPVACAGDLGARWPGVRDQQVHNGTDAHSVARYLSKKETGAAILSASPDVEWDDPAS